MNVENQSTAKLERYAWAAVKGVFVALILSLVLNPVSKGRVGLTGSGAETLLPAQIKAAGMHSIAAQMSGRLVKLTVKPGDRVAAGQLLAVIENGEIEGMIERARRRVELARERVIAGSGGKNSDSAQRRWLDEQYAAAQRTLRATEQRVKDFSLADAERDAARARANAERVRTLLEQRLATTREAEDAQHQADAEQRNLAARRETGVRLKQDLEAAQSQVKMAKLQLETLGAAAAATMAAGDGGYARLELEEAEAALRTLVERARGLKVTAPAGGMVIHVNAEAKGLVQEGAVLIQLADAALLHFDVSAPASVARTVKPGMPVLVRVPADPPLEVTSRVSQVLLEPDPQQRSYLIRVTIPNPAPDGLLVGLEGAVAFSH